MDLLKECEQLCLRCARGLSEEGHDDLVLEDFVVGFIPAIRRAALNALDERCGVRLRGALMKERLLNENEPRAIGFGRERADRTLNTLPVLARTLPCWVMGEEVKNAFPHGRCTATQLV